MRISKAGLLATAGILILFAAGIIEAVLDGMNAQPSLGPLIYAVSIIAGVGLLWLALDIKQREDAAVNAAANARTPQQWDGCVPEPCQLCYGNTAQVRCQPHNLLICLPCCTNHDPQHRCTMYLLPRYAEAQKARA